MVGDDGGSAITNGTVTDRYDSSGKAIQRVGWKVLDFQTEKKKASNRRAKGGEESSAEEQQALPAGLERGQAEDVLETLCLGPVLLMRLATGQVTISDVDFQKWTDWPATTAVSLRIPAVNLDVRSPSDPPRRRLGPLGSLVPRPNGPSTPPLMPRAQFGQFHARYPQVKVQNLCTRLRLRSQAYLAGPLYRASVRW